MYTFTFLTKICIKSNHNTAEERIRIWFGLRQIMNSTNRLLTETRDASKELETGIHMVRSSAFFKFSVAEILYENQLVVTMQGVEHGTVTYLEKIKLLQDKLLAAHSVWVNDNEVPVSLGTDGAPSNNRMSIETVLEMATINAAKSVLWDNEIGSVEVGKKADMIVVNPSSWPMMPVHDCISCLVYGMRTENSTSVMCNGRWIMLVKKITTLNEEEVMIMARMRRRIF